MKNKTSHFVAVLTVILETSTFVQAASTIQFAAANYTVSESDGVARITVQRTNDTESEVGVSYATTDGTATNGLKYTATSRTLAFGASETTKTVEVLILDEGFVQGTKSFRVLLSNPTGGAVLGVRTNVTVSITDNDVGIQFQSTAYTVAENAGAVVIAVVRGDDGNFPVTVDFATTDGTASNGLDYALTTNTISFAPTERLKFISVPVLNNSLKQPNRSFRANLSNATGGTLGDTRNTIVTIVDNDQGCQFESANYTVAEDAGAVLIRVLRGTDDTNSAVTVDCSTADGSATNGVDYYGIINTLAFAPGERVKPITIPILNNGLKQANRNFRLSLSNPTGGAAMGSASTMVSILDNDPGVGFEQPRYTNGWGSASGITVTVLRGNDWALGPITVDYATSNLTAVAGKDFQAISDTLQFQQDETVKNLTIPLLHDRAAEGTKSFRITLSNPTGGATLGAASTTLNIVGANVTVAPPFETELTIQRSGMFNTLTWAGGGLLQKADRPKGPWQTLEAARSPTTIRTPSATTFYRVTRPRPAKLYVPSSYDGQTPMPLMILLHGYGGSGDDVESYMRVQPLAEARGFLYCYPNGTIDRWGNQFWNATEASADFGYTGVDDAGFLRNLIEEIGNRFAVDRKRVYLIGHSNGGFMAYRMACQSADLIAGIASQAGMTFLDPSLCAPSELVNILHIHGTGDNIIPYAGGAVTTANPNFAFPWNTPAFPGALGDIQTWAAYNGASALVEDSAPSLDLTTDVPALDTVVTRYTNFPPGGAVELWTINGGSHSPTLSSQFSRLVIDWLLAHPKP